MVLKFIELPDGKFLVQRRWLGGLFRTYVDNTNPLKFGSWTKGYVKEAVCATRQHAEKMAKLYEIKCSL